MSEEIKINNVNGIDIVQYQPKGVCCKMMQMRIKDDIYNELVLLQKAYTETYKKFISLGDVVGLIMNVQSIIPELRNKYSK